MHTIFFVSAFMLILAACVLFLLVDKIEWSWEKMVHLLVFTIAVAIAVTLLEACVTYKAIDIYITKMKGV